MEERTTLARPYALAAFKLAEEKDQLGLWSEMLEFLSAVAADATIKGIIADPRVKREQVAELFIDIGGGRLSDMGQNFVRALAESGRLGLLPEILALYEEERARAERRQRIEIISAYALNPKFKSLIGQAMQKRLGLAIDLDTRIDRALIGGVIIRAGDLVIDASLRGRLRGLGAALHQ
jgi:F-type H+-transporting ATPase subunit delta